MAHCTQYSAWGRSEVSEPRSAPPTVGQVVLGKRLQDLRERAGMSRDQAAKVLRVTAATVRRMETAEVALKIPLCPGAAEGLRDLRRRERRVRRARGGGQQAGLVAAVPRRAARLVQHVRQPGGGAASLLRMYEPHFVPPGLLQTEDYARTVMRTGAIGQTRPEDIERHVALRMERQSLLTRPDAPRLWVVMDETVLRRPVGSDEIMRARWTSSWKRRRCPT